MADSEFQRPTLAENISMLRNDLFARLDVSDTLRRMDEDVRAKVYAAALHTVYGYIDYRHWMGTGTVGVMIASSDLINPIPEESTETAARQHIEPLAPVAGSDLYVFRPVAHKVDFHIRVTPDTPEIRAAITAELRSFLLRDGYPQGELKVSRISEAISGANGEYSHQLLAPADNISIAKNELAVLGTISWT
ncbi:TPA: baseplate J/gp47 family protein [Escherichia coli]|nr:baseplate J/gp47 family protein [Escherichia coli]HCP3738526.1 baseplate J/gp47 family protein [Escherichia coli]HDD1005682.1 baseplate J/gp47 family protein [Escherichia coli]HDD1145929.1 baseplate J/gp47 family protein [Escherichia coli]HDD1254976.1 baseplate J/gp47 family protein [Escherichia coli]